MERNGSTKTVIGFAVLLLGVSFTFTHPASFANPRFSQVSHGSAHVSQTATNTTITQHSNSTTIQWNSYDVAQNHTVSYNQPSPSSIAINNILDANPSQILGNINANGRVILLNPNGFYIGPSSTISAHTFIAAAISYRDAVYDATTNSLSTINSAHATGNIVVHGTITTTKTQLVANNINLSSSSHITANNYIEIRAHHNLTLHSTLTTTNGDIDIFANQSITGSGTTNSNTATINTDYLSLTGTYHATDSLTINASTILLNNTASLNSNHTRIFASNSALVSATITGHQININATNTLTILNATINANHPTDAGTITIGNINNPPTTLTVKNSTIAANSTTNGDAGTITIYATNTVFSASATATAITGNGGFIEISGTNRLTLNPTHLDTTSTHGAAGTIYIDPRYIVITQNPFQTSTTLDLYRSFINSISPSLAEEYDSQSDSQRGIYDYYPNPIDGDQFGLAIALNNAYALIGAPGVSSNRGNAYLFNLSTETWLDLSTTDTDSTTSGAQNPITNLNSNSRFGASVALNNDYALIGAPGVSSNRGSAYLYRLDGTNIFTSSCRTTGTLTSPWCTLSLTDTLSAEGLQNPITDLSPNSDFGFSVALNNDYALIGAPGVENDRGSAYLYRVDGEGALGEGALDDRCFTDSTSFKTAWCSLSSTDTDSTTNDAQNPIVDLDSNSRFGTSVALNDTYALIGAPGVSFEGFSSLTVGLVSGDAIPGLGRSFLFHLGGTNAFTSSCRTTGTPLTSPWCILSTTLTLNNPFSGAEIGIPIPSLIEIPIPSFPMISGETYQNARFGASVALNDTYALIGAPGVSSDRGGAYLYRLDGTNAFTSTCQTTGTLTSPWCALSSTDTDSTTSGAQNPITNLNSNSRFGTSVALNATYALIGAPGVSSNRGDAYLYRLNGIDGFSSQCHTTLNLTSPWCRLQNTPSDLIDPSSSLEIGRSVAINSTTLLLGGISNTLLSYGYSSSERPWEDITMQVRTQANSISMIPTRTEGFGTSVALNDTYALIGAPGISSNRGNAYLFNLLTETWLDLSTTDTDSTTSGAQNPITNLNSNSRFGTSVALNDTYALIGAPGVSSNRGSAYLYRLDGANSFTSNCSVTGSSSSPLTSSWCALSLTDTDSTTSGAQNPIINLNSNSRFGTSVALNDTYALIGAPGVSSDRGGSYLYRLDGTNSFTSNCSVTGSSSSPLTSSWCALSLTDTDSTTSGAQNPIINLNSNSRFGTSVALNDTYALIGAPGVSDNRGDAFLYRLDGTNSFTSNCSVTGSSSSPLTSSWCALSLTDTDSTTSGAQNPITNLNSNSRFGTSVALNDTYALIGAPGVSDNRGDAYLYRLDGTNSFASNCSVTGSSSSPLTSSWCALSLTDTDSTTSGAQNPITNLNSNSRFGTSVALNDTYALIGAPGVSDNRGDAFLYRLDGTNSFTSNCSVTGSSSSPLTSSWCIFSIPDIDSTMPGKQNSVTALPNNSFFGGSVALHRSYAIIGSSYSSTLNTYFTNAHLVFLPRLFRPAFNDETTFITPTMLATMLAAGNVSLEASNDITFLSPVTYSGSNTLTLTSMNTINANPLDLLTDTSNPLISVNAIVLNSQGNIGSATLPFNLETSSLTINAGTHSVYLSRSANAFAYLSETITAGLLSLTQTTGDINITSPINLPTTNLTLTASAGAITTTLTSIAITTGSLSLNAAGNIGSNANPFILSTAGSLTINAGTNSIFLAHPTDVSTSFTVSGTPGSLSLLQTTGNISITSPILLPSTNLTLTALAGAITTTLTTTAIAASSLTLNAAGNVGSSSAPLFLSSSGTLRASSAFGTIYLAHPTDVSTFFSLSGTFRNLSLSQTTGNISITSPLSLSGTNLTLTAQDGAISTTLNSSNTTITANNLTLNAAGNIGSSSNPFILNASGNLSIDSSLHSVFLAHPTDVSTYLPLSGTFRSLFLLQTTGDISISAPILLSSRDLALTASAGSITTTLTSATITANNLTLTAAGNIGSSANPFILSTAGSLTINAGTGSVFLAHPTDISIYLPLVGTADSLSLVQTTGNISITSAISLPTTNLTLTAQSGAITTTLTSAAITANNLTLNAAGNIGSNANPFILSTAGSLTINAGTGSVFLAHPTDISIYLPLVGTADSLSLVQTTGNISITSAISLPTTNLTLTAQSGAITTTLTSAAITANNLTLNAAGNIGSISLPLLANISGMLSIGVGTRTAVLGAPSSSHLSEVSIYLPLVGSDSSLTLTQATGDITIASPIMLPGTSLTITARDGAIIANPTTDAENNIVVPTITANNLTLNAAGNIGSNANPFILSTAGSLTINAGTNSVFLSHPTDISIYLPLVGTAGSLSLVQTTGNISITSAITLPTTNLTLTAQSGTITTTLTSAAITANNLALTAAGNIGSATNPFILSTAGSLTINAGTGSVFLAHPTDISIYLPLVGTADSLSLVQTTGNISITSAITLPTTNLTLSARSGAITTTLTSAAITANNLTLNAAGNIGSATNPFILSTAGSLTINAGTNSVFLAHPTDISIYLPLVGTAGSLSLVQTTGNISITSAITLPTTNLTLTAQSGAITTTLTSAAITANNLALTAAGNIGSATNPFILSTAEFLTIDAGTNSVFLAHPTDIFTYISLSGTYSSLSLTQTTGNISITSAIIRSATNLTLTAQDGDITTTLDSTTIAVASLTLNAAGNIGSAANPFLFNVSGSLTINAGTNDVFLVHPTDVYSLLSNSITAGAIYLTQTNGDLLNNGFRVDLGQTELSITALQGNITILNAITASRISLNAAGSIRSLSSSTALTASAIVLRAEDGDIGDSINRIYIRSDSIEGTFDFLQVITSTFDGEVFLRLDQNQALTSHTHAMDLILNNLPENSNLNYTVTIFNDDDLVYNEDNDLRFTVSSSPRRNSSSNGEGSFTTDIVNTLLSIFGDDCDDDESDITIISDILEALCM